MTLLDALACHPQAYRIVSKNHMTALRCTIAKLNDSSSRLLFCSPQTCLSKKSQPSSDSLMPFIFRAAFEIISN